MIIVTGTMRSGTSMWMQILAAAGLPIIGAEFPGPWRERIGDANKNGFYESILRDGIYYRTNPHPRSGTYLHPQQTSRHVVKVFAPGLVRSEIAFLDRVLLSIRPFREYAASLSRLMELERQSKSREAGRELPAQPHVPHALRWWDDNFSALHDSMLRGYPTHVIAYDTVLEDRAAVARVLRWLQAPNVEAGLAQVDAAQRTQRRATPSAASAGASGEDDLPPGIASLFDELYERVRSSRGLDESFIAALNRADELLAPQVARARAQARRERRARVEALTGVARTRARANA